MKELIEKLENPFDNIKSNDEVEFQDKCSEIANMILKNYCIQCYKKKYFFAEIEFYYYEKGKWDKEWNEITYPRKDKKAGDFFFHYSGFDICFNSNYNENMAKFGGILIRSLKDETGNFITGPTVCSLDVLNSCFGKTWPKLVQCSNQECKVCENPIKRYGIKYKDNQKEDKDLCFYDERIKEKLKNEFENATWDYSKYKDGTVKGQKKLIRYYHRFE